MIFLENLFGFKSKKRDPGISFQRLSRSVVAEAGGFAPLGDVRGEKKGPTMNKGRIKVDLLIHDIKGPLAVIEAGILSLMKRREKYGALTQKQEKVLKRILRNTKTTQRLVGDALELGRSREGVFNATRFKLSDLIEQALVEAFDLADTETAEKVKSCAGFLQLKQVLDRKGVTLSVDEEVWCGEVHLDEVKIRQILRNLLNNALKYRSSHVELGVDIKDNSLFFSVKDDGEGIPLSYHRKIFECYFQMDTGEVCCPVRGHGLGLAGVMVLLEDMGGKLSLESEEGQGARFLVELPL
jgi:signal transduction histidine kinase